MEDWNIDRNPQEEPCPQLNNAMRFLEFVSSGEIHEYLESNDFYFIFSTPFDSDSISVYLMQADLAHPQFEFDNPKNVALLAIKLHENSFFELERFLVEICRKEFYILTIYQQVTNPKITAKIYEEIRKKLEWNLNKPIPEEEMYVREYQLIF